jgi:hypothetical protein
MTEFVISLVACFEFLHFCTRHGEDPQDNRCSLCLRYGAPVSDAPIKQSEPETDVTKAA